MPKHLTVSNCGVYNPLSIGNSQVLRIIHVKSLFLHGLQKLKKVRVRGIQEIYIDAPNLEFFQFSANHPDASFKLNVDTSTNLIRLCLRNLKIIDGGDEYFLELFSKLPFLESLELCHCYLPHRINIISAQLKVFKLYDCSNLKEVNIDAPNLLSLDYHGEDKPVLSFARSSNQLQASVFTTVDYSNFYSLRDFIRNIPQKILASLSLFVIHPIRDNPYIMPALEVSCTFQVSNIWF
ncbi:hypothetical protein PIB30_056958 [Stylosanthes scabra]|uniref:At1g61320/AtMIF1 LRR domain-containing protein n=1 Tax=Stylosanthes scabra TaxID=79078 RepID=A0ABU6WJI5_9FABA|nr:hypothetical protein [Stylosanthes scabra]